MSHSNRSLASTTGFCSFLNRVPLETINSIIDLIDDRSDILSLALTCKSFAKHLIPSILDYREIRAPFELSQIWRHLANNPTLARRVREICLMGPCTPHRLPQPIERRIRRRGRLDLAEGEEAEKFFFQVLKSLPRLVSFRWPSSMHHYRYSFNRLGYDKVWGILSTHCPNLQYLEISDTVNVLSGEALEGRSKQLFIIQGLKSCEYSFAFEGIKSKWLLSPSYLIPFLSINSSLRVLSLSVPRAFADQFLPLEDEFGDIHLPSLESFSLKGLTFHNPDTLCRFLRLNDSIQSLELHSSYPLPSLAKGDLPNLVHFSSRFCQWEPICLAIPPLRQLDIHATHDQLDTPGFIDAVKVVSGTLRTVCIGTKGAVANPATAATVRQALSGIRVEFNVLYW